MKFLKTQRLILFCILTGSQYLYAKTQNYAKSNSLRSEKIIGEYSPSELKYIKIKCQKEEIKYISLVPMPQPMPCQSKIQIKNFTVKYLAGFKQYFDYEESSSEPAYILTRSSYEILPGNKCISGISANLSVVANNNTACASNQKIQVVVQ